MTGKKTALALIAGFIASNVLTTIYYLITDEPNFVPIRRDQTIYAGMMLTHLIFVGIMVVMFPRWVHTTGSLLSQGALFGALMAGMMFIPQAILVRSIWTVDFNVIFIINSIAHVVIGAVIGMIIAQIMGQPEAKLSIA